MTLVSKGRRSLRPLLFLAPLAIGSLAFVPPAQHRFAAAQASNSPSTALCSSSTDTTMSKVPQWFQHEISITAPSRGCHLITSEITKAIKSDISSIKVGMCNLFIQHTSASLTINENADPDVRRDMEVALNKIVPGSWTKDGTFLHTMEGEDDMPGHVKSSLMGPSLNIPRRAPSPPPSAIDNVVMKLTAEQTEDLPFPVGCPVWYGFSPGNEGGGAPQLLKEAVVESVSFDVISKDMVYVVTYDDGNGTKVVDTIPEKNLAYAANCPVTIDPGDKTSAEGTVLLCESSNEEPRKLLYTAMVPTEGCRARYESGIERRRLKFRRVKKLEVNTSPPENVVAQKEQPAAEAPADSSLVGEEVVPSSITCDSVAKSSHSKEGSSKREASGGSSQASNTAKKARTDATPTHVDAHKLDGHLLSKQPHDKKKLVFGVPLWLQRDLQTQQRLFRHLVSRGGVNDIGKDTNCRIHVRFNCNVKPSADTNPMVIEVTALPRASRIRDLGRAREMITDLLLEFDDVGRDGARGRLVHEVALQCHGPHRPNKSTCGAVQVRNPFGADDKCTHLSVLELPFEVYKGRREYHASYLLDPRFLDHHHFKSRCGTIKLVGGDFGTRARYCNPYVLVTGHLLRDVDYTAELVKNEIRRHMDKCVCRLR